MFSPGYKKKDILESTMPNSKLPLERFKVLDLARVRSGPTAVKVLQIGELMLSK